MTIYVLPLWIVGVLGCWIPWLIAKDKTEPRFQWTWFMFGIACLPMAILFAILEKPAAERARYNSALET